MYDNVSLSFFLVISGLAHFNLPEEMLRERIRKNVEVVGGEYLGGDIRTLSGVYFYLE